MNNENEGLRNALREAFAPPGDGGPAGDLWPRMLRRLDRGQARPGWLDWALAAAALAWMILFPEIIPSLLYHL